MHDWIKILVFTFYLTFYLWHFTNPMTAETGSCLNCSLICFVMTAWAKLPVHILRLHCFFWLAHSHLFLPSSFFFGGSFHKGVKECTWTVSCSVQLYCIYLAYHSNLKSFLNPFFPFNLPFLYKTLQVSTVHGYSLRLVSKSRQPLWRKPDMLLQLLGCSLVHAG